MLRKLIVGALALFTPLFVEAQEEPYYYPYERWRSEEPTPILRSDTMLFYRAVQHPMDPYGELTRYTYSFIASSRRGHRLYEEPVRVGDLSVDYALWRQLSHWKSDNAASEEALFDVNMETGHRLRLSLTDRNYRLGLRYDYGCERPEKWQLQLRVEGRTGRDLHAMGVYTRSLGFSLRLQRNWALSRLLFLVACNPSERGLAASSTEEVFNLVDDPYYNPAWGYWRGEVRSGRVAREILPVALFAFEHEASERTRLRLSLALEAGVSRLSGVGWFDTPTPRPDYYRNLPSHYADPAIQELVAERWRSHDTRYTQIDWEELYQQNRMAQGEALYVEQDRVERRSRVGLSLAGTTLLGSSLELRYGVELHYDRHRHYLELRDLLGADYLTDRDCFLIDDDSYSSLLENDLRHPGRRVGEGDRFSYDYALDRASAEAAAGLNYYTDRLRLAASIRLGEELVGRKGFFEKELFAGEQSWGRSKWVQAPCYTLAIGGSYALSPRRALHLRLNYEARLPESDYLFLQPQYNNRTIDTPTPKGSLEVEMGYSQRADRWSLRGDLFLDYGHNNTQTDRYYDDLSGLYCDRVVRGIATLIYGVEGCLEWRAHRNLALAFTLSAAASTYVGEPRVDLYDDRNNQLLCAGAHAYMKGCHPGAFPHLGASAEATYFGRGWGLNLQMALAALRYAHPDFGRRTARIAQGASTSPEAFEAFMAQAELPVAFRLDLSAWKSFSLGERSRLILYASLRNLCGSRHTPYDRYESPRLHRLTTGEGIRYLPMEDRLRYAAPRSLWLSLSFRY